MKTIEELLPSIKPEIFKLSNTQKAIYYSTQMCPETSINYILITYYFKMNYSLDQLVTALNSVIHKHDFFSLDLIIREGNPFQHYSSEKCRINEPLKFQSENEHQQYINLILTESNSLSWDKLCTFYPFMIIGGGLGVTMNIHHVIADGWTVELISDLIESELNNSPIKISGSDVFKRYAEKQEKYLLSQKYSQDLKFWKNYLNGDIERIDLPRKSSDYKAEKISYSVDAETRNRIELFCKKTNLSVYKLFLYLLKVFIYHWKGNKDFLIGTIFHGRVSDEMKASLGIFIDTYPIRFKISPNKIEDIQTIKDDLGLLFDRQMMPYKEIVSLTGGKDPVQILISFEETVSKINKTLHTPQYEIYPLVFHINKRGKDNPLMIDITYQLEVFEKEGIESISPILLHIFNQVEINHRQAIADFSLISLSPKKMLHSHKSTIVSILDNYFKNSLNNKKAIVDNENSITYCELSKKIARIRAFLFSKGIKKGDKVLVYAEKNISTLTCMLGILFCGGVYVPVDPMFPNERLKFIIDDCNVYAIVTDRKLSFVSSVSQYHIQSILDENLEIKYFSEQIEIDPEDGAYIIYTSGSTGNPKGVLVKHRNIVSALLHSGIPVTLNSEIQSALFHSLSFDASVLEIYIALLNQGTVFIVPQMERLDPIKFLLFIQANQISFIAQVPSVFYNLYEQLALETSFDLSCLKYICIGGESLNTSQLRNLFEVLPEVRVFNQYGPTETTIFVSYKEVTIENINCQFSNIGKAVNGTDIIIINHANKALPCGWEGEIAISGLNVSAGYVNNPELMDEKFIFINDSLFYKSGDLGRITQTGDIEFLGRIDNQIKIRGYRIELEEVELNILKHPSIKQCAVLILNDEDPILCAVISVSQFQHIDDIKKWLNSRLPNYMIPSIFKVVDKFPLTNNSKIDRKALKLILINEKDNWREHNNLDRYESIVEEQIANVWKELLNIRQINRIDDFFSIGGDSIKAIQCVTKLRKKGYELKVSDFFDSPVLYELSGKIKTVKKRERKIYTSYPLTPIQNWFFCNKFTYENEWCQYAVCSLPENINIEILEKIINKIINAYEAFRTIYYKNNKGLIFSTITDFLEPVELHSYNNSLEKVVKKLSKKIDIGNGPLFNAGIIQESGKKELILCAHHLSVDGVSWRIILNDIYQSYKDDSYSISEDLPFSFWAHELARWIDGPAVKLTQSYWNSITRDKAYLGKVHDSNSCNENKVQTISLKIDDFNLFKLLSKVQKRLSITLEQIVLTAFTLSMCDVLDTKALAVIKENHGREFDLLQLETGNSIGWFTVLYPLILSREDDLLHTLASIKETLSIVPHRGLSWAEYFSIKTDCISDLKNEIFFNFLGEFNSRSDHDIQLKRIGLYSNPKNKTPAFLDFNCWIEDGLLNYTFRFPEVLHKNVKRSCELFKNYLFELLGVCENYKEKIYTRSDFAADFVEIDYFRNLLRAYGNDNISRFAQLSPLETGILIQHLKDPDSTAYHEQLTVAYSGNLNKENLEEALDIVIEKNENLRASFPLSKPDSLLKVFIKDAEIPVEEVILNSSDRIAEILTIHAKNQLKTGFDLEYGPLCRCLNIKTGDEKGYLLFEFHHLILDGWSVSILMKQIYEILNYKAVSINSSGLKEVENWYLGIDKENSRSFWKLYLSGLKSGIISVPPLYNSHGKYTPGWGEYLFSCLLSDRIRLFSKNNNLTAGRLIQILWAAFLGRINSKDDVAFGYITAIRPSHIPDIDEAVGLLLNALPVRVSLNGTFREICTREYIPDEHKAFPLYKIEREFGGPLFNHLLVFENYPFESSFFKQEGDSIHFHSMHAIEQTQYPLNIAVIPNEQFKFSFYFDCRNYSLQYLLQIMDAFEGFIKNVIADPDKEVKHISLVSEISRDDMLRLAETKNAELFNEKTLFSELYRICQMYPDKTALVRNDKQVTYNELRQRAEAVAVKINETADPASGPVVIIMDRSIEGIYGLLGAVFSGRPYVPVDWDYPEGRIKHIIENCEPSVILSTDTKDLFIDQKYTVVSLDTFDFTLKGKFTAPEIIGKDSAYIIYTSGSTGKPKGVEVSHSNVINMVDFYTEKFAPSFLDKSVLSASPGFDAMVLELWPMLLCGAELHIVPPDIRLFSDRLKEWLLKHEITVGFFPTPIAERLIHEKWPKSGTSLRYMLTGGDTLRSRPGKKLPFLLYNLYGPTEITVFCTCSLVHPYNHSEGDIRPDIGFPITNHKVYILDENGDPCPVGIFGEIYIGGAGVAKGYYNNTKLTLQRFIPNLFRDNERMYVTGDTGRFLPDGRIEFSGRNDNQLQIRGNRVEIGEIEHVMKRITEISDAVVIPKKDVKGNPYLTAFVSLEENCVISVPEIRNNLASELPLFMIPAAIIITDEFHYTANGKIDRKAFESKKLQDESRSYISPRNVREELIIEIWEELLGKDKIGIKDNFFEFGGDSLLAVQVHSELSKTFELPLNAVFEYETPELLAGQIIRKHTSLTSNISRIEKNDKLLKDPLDVYWPIKDELKEYQQLCDRTVQAVSGNLDSISNYENIFLTGSTGYLGCFLLDSLVKKYPFSTVIVLVRQSKKGKSAEKRFTEKVEYYLGKKWFKRHKDTVRVVSGNIEQQKLGLESQEYMELSSSIDCIVNSAALVKHYGKYDDFHGANVQGPENLLEFAVTGKKKDFHHISTLSVGLPGMENNDVFLFTEFKAVNADSDNYYIKTKIAAETKIKEARKQGINTNIYRVGNLMFHSESGIFQQNIGDNAFYKALQSYSALGYIPDLRHKIFDLSFIDSTADAVVSLLSCEALQNQILHVYNPSFISLYEIGQFFQLNGKNLKTIPYNAFINALYKRSEDPAASSYIGNLLLHSHILDNPHITGFVQKCSFTSGILKKMNFTWPEVCQEQFKRMLAHCDDRKFFI